MNIEVILREEGKARALTISDKFFPFLSEGNYIKIEDNIYHIDLIDFGIKKNKLIPLTVWLTLVEEDEYKRFYTGSV